MIIPREGDTLRLYQSLNDRDVIDPATGRADMNRCGPEKLLEVRRRPMISASKLIFRILYLAILLPK